MTICKKILVVFWCYTIVYCLDNKIEIVPVIDNSNDTKLFIMPTASTLEKYGCNIQGAFFVLPHLSYGLSNRLTIGVGKVLDTTSDLFWISSKVQLMKYKSTKFTAGFFSLRKIKYLKEPGIEVYYFVSSTQLSKSNMTIGTYLVREFGENIFYYMPLYFGIVKNTGNKMNPIFEFHLIPNEKTNFFNIVGISGYRRYGNKWDFDIGVLVYPFDRNVGFGPIFAFRYNINK